MTAVPGIACTHEPDALVAVPHTGLLDVHIDVTLTSCRAGNQQVSDLGLGRVGIYTGAMERTSPRGSQRRALIQLLHSAALKQCTRVGVHMLTFARPCMTLLTCARRGGCRTMMRTLTAMTGADGGDWRTWRPRRWVADDGADRC